MKTRRFSITDKLIIASVVLSSIIILIVASYSYRSARIAVVERAFNQLNSVRVVKTNLIEAFFNNCVEDVKLAQSSIEIKRLAEKLNQYPDSLEKNALIYSSNIETSSFINELEKDIYGNIYIISKHKTILPIKKDTSCFEMTNFDSLWFYSRNKKEVFIQDYRACANDKHLHLNLSLPIYNADKQPIGLIVFEVLPSAIDSIMLNNQINNGLGKSGESYLVGRDYYMRSSSRFQDHSIMKMMVKTEAVDSAFHSQQGERMIKDYRNILVLSSYDIIKVPGLHWAILAEIDYKEVLIPVVKIRREIVFVSIFIFLIVIVVVIVLSKRITYPIEKLNQAVQRVGEGDFDACISSKTDDEIGELTDTFNKMIVKLKEQSEELDKERAKSLRSLIDGQERERQRLSRELHDSLGQILIALKLKYEGCINKSGVEASRFTDLRLLFDQTIEETRRISNNLMPSALSEFGLSTAVRNICNDISDMSDIQVVYKVEGSGNKLDTETKIYLFRIIQEGLTNIIKHSNAKKACVELIIKKETIFVLIKDDGQGFNLNISRSTKSNGINNIYERVALLSGGIEINSKPGNGTEIRVNIPK